MHINIFQSLFAGDNAEVLPLSSFAVCILCSLIIGLLLAVSYMYRTRYTKSFVATLALMPAAVCVVIMMVNGNVGAGVAVAGAFSLVRFRSAQGSAREISAIFLAMGAGLIAGMGYIAYALLFSAILSAVSMIYNSVGFGSRRNLSRYKTLHITIPENLDYTGVFDDLLCEFTSSYELVQTKTTNMGSLFKLTYQLVMKDSKSEKEFIDKLRCRNGNLEITVSSQENISYQL